MGISSTVLQGNSVAHNKPPLAASGALVQLPGRFNNTAQRIPINEDILSKHILLLGCTGCGKTNIFYFFIQQLKQKLTKDDVMIVFDTKGDFFQRFYSPGDQVIANSRQYRSVMTPWNIYKEIYADGDDPRELTLNTYEITRSLFFDAIKKNTSQPFFPNAACDLLAAIITCNIRAGHDDLAFKRSYFNNQALRDYLDRVTPERLREVFTYPDLAAALTYLGQGDNDQGLGVMAELQNVIRQTFIGAFAQQGGFSVRQFVRQKQAKTLFIEYDLSLGSTLTPIYRLLIDLALKEALGRQKSQGNVYIICDEFKLLPNLQHIEDGVNFGRSLGVKVMAGLQSIEQLYEIYGESGGKNIAAGFSSVFSFRANDASSRDFISSLHGKNIVLEQYTNATNTLVENKREGRTVEDWHMNELSIGEAIVSLPFSNPFRFQFDLFR